MDLEQLTTFFGWMTLINVIVLTLSSLLIMALKDAMCRLHGKMFGLTEQQVSVAAYGYLGVYKALVLVLVIVPYISLLLMR